MDGKQAWVEAVAEWNRRQGYVKGKKGGKAWEQIGKSHPAYEEVTRIKNALQYGVPEKEEAAPAPELPKAVAPGTVAAPALTPVANIAREKATPDVANTGKLVDIEAVISKDGKEYELPYKETNLKLAHFMEVKLREHIAPLRAAAEAESQAKMAAERAQRAKEQAEYEERLQKQQEEEEAAYYASDEYKAFQEKQLLYDTIEQAAHTRWWEASKEYRASDEVEELMPLKYGFPQRTYFKNSINEVWMRDATNLNEIGKFVGLWIPETGRIVALTNPYKGEEWDQGTVEELPRPLPASDYPFSIEEVKVRGKELLEYSAAKTADILAQAKALEKKQKKISAKTAVERINEEKREREERLKAQQATYGTMPRIIDEPTTESDKKALETYRRRLAAEDFGVTGDEAETLKITTIDGKRYFTTSLNEVWLIVADTPPRMGRFVGLYNPETKSFLSIRQPAFD